MSPNLAEKPPQKPPEKPAPADPPKSIVETMGGLPPGGVAFVPAPKPTPAPLKQLPEAWAAESAQQLRQDGDENSARTVDLWLAVAKTPAVAAFNGEPVTLEEYERGIKEAKDHSPAEHATRKNGAR